MRALLEDGAWSPAADTVILLLTKPDPGKKTGIKLPRFDALVGGLTSAQQAAIAAVLHVFATTNEEGSPGERARTALERHWDAYLPGRS